VKDGLHGCVQVEGSAPASSFWALFWHLPMLCVLGTAQSSSGEQYVCSMACLFGHNTTSRNFEPRG